MKSWVRSLVLVLFLAAITLPLPVMSMGDVGFMPNRSVGQAAKDFTLPTAKGGQFRFSEAVAGKRAVIVFWATWCPYCRQELKKMSRLTGKLKDEGIVPIYINIGESKNQVSDFLKANHYDFDVVLDERQVLGQDYPVEGIPTLYFMNEAGTIKAVDHTLPEDYLRYF